MSHALESVGFVNYPTEFWHWSYGDRYWAYHHHQPHCFNNASDKSWQDQYSDIHRKRRDVKKESQKVAC